MSKVRRGWRPVIQDDLYLLNPVKSYGASIQFNFDGLQVNKTCLNE